MPTRDVDPGLLTQFRSGTAQGFLSLHHERFICGDRCHHITAVVVTGCGDTADVQHCSLIESVRNISCDGDVAVDSCAAGRYCLDVKRGFEHGTRREQETFARLITEVFLGLPGGSSAACGQARSHYHAAVKRSRHEAGVAPGIDHTSQGTGHRCPGLGLVGECGGAGYGQDQEAAFRILTIGAGIQLHNDAGSWKQAVRKLRGDRDGAGIEPVADDRHHVKIRTGVGEGLANHGAELVEWVAHGQTRIAFGIVGKVVGFAQGYQAHTFGLVGCQFQHVHIVIYQQA